MKSQNLYHSIQFVAQIVSNSILIFYCLFEIMRKFESMKLAKISSTFYSLIVLTEFLASSSGEAMGLNFFYV